MHLSGRLPSHSEEWARQSIALKGSVVLGSGFSLGILGLIRSVLVVRPLPAQAIGQGFELERAGQYDQAAAIYLATLRAEPTNLSALLGLERVLPPINRLGELLPAAQRAAASSPSNVALRGVLLRTYVALNEPDSGRAVALRWAAAAPGDEAPYREWAMALEDAHRHGPARDVLLLGRRALGRPGAFGIELAELSQLSGDWEGAAREWAAALTDAPVQLPNAASALAEAPDAQRERIARLLTGGTPSTLTRRLAGELLLNWGQPLRAWAVFEPSVATPSADAAFAARRFADLAGARSTPDARRARALALARYADLAPEVGGAAARARADAARAFIEAGDRVAARAVLERVAQDSNAPPDAQRLAQRAVVEALIEGGQRNEAAQQLATNARLSPDDRASLRLQLVRARIAAGELDRADTELARDSSVEALALQGWIALYRGRLGEAQRLFLAAGPYAGGQRDAVDRTTMVALLQRVPGDSFPELGSALSLLARGDSLRAVAALRLAAARLATGESGGGGRPDLLLLAGRVAARLDTLQQGTALALFDEVVSTGGQGAAAPAAELEWARLLERRAQTAEAHVTAIRGEIEASNMDAVPLEKAPKVAVYVPPNAPPWDDAVTMALQYAGIQFDKVWDFEVIGGKLVGYDWLHLHHEDFTGQYSKFYLIYAGAPWLAEMVRFNTDAAKRLGFVTVPDLKKAVARKIRDYVTNGGFLFAMCTATETLDLALAAERTDIAAAFADGTPMDPQADAKLDWSKALAFTGAQVEPNPPIASFSDIDGHQVNAGPRRQPLGAFKLFNFSAKIDPVPTLLVQNHRQVIPDFYGLTTSFLRSRLKPSDVVLADEEGAPWVKYINGNHGKGTWTFFGGHDPEDQQHQIGDPPTDLSLHPHSPGYRLILNNVLFPAAKKRERKT